MAKSLMEELLGAISLVVPPHKEVNNLEEPKEAKEVAVEEMVNPLHCLLVTLVSKQLLMASNNSSLLVVPLRMLELP